MTVQRSQIVAFIHLRRCYWCCVSIIELLITVAIMEVFICIDKKPSDSMIV